MRGFRIPMIILTCLAAVSAHAEGFTARGSMDGTATSDSSVQIRGTAPSADQNIFITVIREDTGERVPNSFYGAGPDFSRKVYLPKGAGEYEILVFGAKPGQYIQDSLAQFRIKNLDTRDLSFLLPSGSVESDDPEIISLANSITSGLTNDYDRTRAIHDWVAGNIRYDLSNDDEPPMDAVGTLKTRMTICSGYAALTAALNRAIGLRAKIVQGIGDSDGIAAAENDPPHVWNEVQVDGRWVTEDTTFDSGSVNRRGKFIPGLSEDFFDPAPAFFAQTHQKQQEEPY